MKVRNKRSLREFEITKEEWNSIVESVLAYKYDVIEDDSPLEIKSLRFKKDEKEIKSKKKND